jgi:hypothetical protein
MSLFQVYSDRDNGRSSLETDETLVTSLCLIASELDLVDIVLLDFFRGFSPAFSSTYIFGVLRSGKKIGSQLAEGE